MALLSLDQLGARESSAGVVEFGLLLPWVSASDGNRLFVKMIHERDQFLQAIPPQRFELTHSIDPVYGDRWSTQVDLSAAAPVAPASHWGAPGTYVYRYEIETPGRPPIDWVTDPCAREFGVGKLSAVTIGAQAYTWSPHEATWRVPATSDLVIYELMLAEFASDISKAIDRLDYVADLGVTCLEVMPVTNVTGMVDWGFLPVGYFGVDDRYGRAVDFQRFVDEAHQRGLAVIVDAVYGHTSDQFAYSYAYRHLGYLENPFLGSFGADYFGESTDFRRPLVRDFFLTVNAHWLATYHVDGFRYDCVPCYWDGPVGQGYAGLAYDTYRLVEDHRGDGEWQRFFTDAGPHRLVQCAEQLERPVEVLRSTYTTTTWQNGTLGAAAAVADGNRTAIESLGLLLGANGYPSAAVHDTVTLATAPLQYIENHDHSRFITHFGVDTHGEPLLGEGDRSRWYKLQPYLIALLTSVGVPMLWQGEELGENYVVPDDRPVARVGLLRPLRWEYFYDTAGTSILQLVRQLLALRRQQAQFRHGAHYFYNHWDRYQSHGVMVFSRRNDTACSIVALNFTDDEQRVPFEFPVAGDYREELHGAVLRGVTTVTQDLQLPSNYGRIWTIDR